MTRPATPDDGDRICRGLPDTELGVTWGDGPPWKVPAGEKGKGFVLFRKPHKTAIDPETGERFWREILAVGGSRPALDSFKAFRGREPKVDALLRHSGMVAQA